jgi:hypothetical protein
MKVVFFMWHVHINKVTLYLFLQPAEDVAVIFAEPNTVDLISVISDPKLVLLIQALLWNQVRSKLKQP